MPVIAETCITPALFPRGGGGVDQALLAFEQQHRAENAGCYELPETKAGYGGGTPAPARPGNRQVSAIAGRTENHRPTRSGTGTQILPRSAGT